MAGWVVLRSLAGLALLGYAVFAFAYHQGSLMPLIPAVVGAYLLLRGIAGARR